MRRTITISSIQLVVVGVLLMSVACGGSGSPEAGGASRLGAADTEKLLRELPICVRSKGANCQKLIQARTEAAEDGDVLAQAHLGVLLAAAERPEEATSWVEKAASAEDPSSLVFLAEVLEAGVVEEPNPIAAVALYARASELGAPGASEEAARIIQREADIVCEPLAGDPGWVPGAGAAGHAIRARMLEQGEAEYQRCMKDTTREFTQLAGLLAKEG